MLYPLRDWRTPDCAHDTDGGCQKCCHWCDLGVRDGNPPALPHHCYRTSIISGGHCESEITLPHWGEYCPECVVRMGDRIGNDDPHFERELLDPIRGEFPQRVNRRTEWEDDYDAENWDYEPLEGLDRPAPSNAGSAIDINSAYPQRVEPWPPTSIHLPQVGTYMRTVVYTVRNLRIPSQSPWQRFIGRNR